jgi:hypothetical protein
MRHVAEAAFSLCFVLAGCVPTGDTSSLVSNPFNQLPEARDFRAFSSPASQEAACRALCIGEAIIKANPEMGLHPHFLTIAAPEVEVFHKGERELYLTEGMTKQCITDGQLAAVLCSELAKMAAEREARALPQTRQPDREPPPDVPVGNDAGGVFGAPDGVRMVELARYEHERLPRDVTLPPPSPSVLERRYLQKAGYTLDDLDAAKPLLRQSEANGLWQKQINGGF